MKQHHENLLIASLAGLVIVSAAAFVVIPAGAVEYQADTTSHSYSARP